MLLCTQANKLRCQSKNEAAEQLYEEALQADSSPSYISICRRYLADANWANAKAPRQRKPISSTKLLLHVFPEGLHLRSMLQQTGIFLRERTKTARFGAELRYAPLALVLGSRSCGTTVQLQPTVLAGFWTAQTEEGRWILALVRACVAVLSLSPLKE